MRIVRKLLRAPPAVMYWLGVGRTRAMEEGEDAIFLCHGTPHRGAALLERQLRFLRRVFTLVPLAELAASTSAARAPARRRRAAIIDVDERTLAGVRRHYRAAVNSGSTSRLDPHPMPNRHLPRGVLSLAWQLNHPPAH